MIEGVTFSKVNSTKLQNAGEMMWFNFRKSDANLHFQTCKIQNNNSSLEFLIYRKELEVMLNKIK